VRNRDFDLLGRRLLRAGVLPRQVERMLSEMQDHYADLVDELEQHGCPPERARQQARREFGSLETIESIVKRYPELRRWPYRYPALGRSVLPVATALLAPIPGVLRACAATSTLVRWGCIVSASATITAAMMLAMQIAIALP